MNKRIFLMMLIFFQIGKANAVNYPPVVRIESPKNYSNFKLKEEITFKGKVTDLEDGDLSGEALVWTSDMDGRISQGNSFSAVLSQGFHIVVLTATDSGNSVARDSIFITIGTPSEPISEVEKPKEEKPKLEKPKIETLKLKKQTIPSIVFLFVPSFGSFKLLQGQILNTDPNKFGVAVYIMKEGVWWSKSAIKVTKDGKWISDITTAKDDELAIKIVAYLIPIDYQPPIVSGEFWILKEIEEKSLAKIEVTRKIRSKPEVKKPEIKKETPSKPVIAEKSIDTSEQKLTELQALLAQLNDQEEKLRQLEESLKKDEQRVKKILDEAESLDKELIRETVKIQAEIYQFQKETKDLREEVKEDKKIIIDSIEKVLEIRKKILQEALLSVITVPLVVYKDADSKENSFQPSGRMGDIECIELDRACEVNPYSGKTCVRITYNPDVSLSKRWSGIYWQYPLNNWGDYPGYELSGMSKLTFYARGKKGNEMAEFKVGGIRIWQKPYYDSFGPIPTDIIELTLKWKKFSIDLRGCDTSNLIGGFCFVTNRLQNMNGCTIYLDNIQFEP